MPTPQVLAFAGSTREGSFNKRLLRYAVACAREAGAAVDVVDLRDYPMPLYDADLEAREGLPEPARAFKRALVDHHALLVASPEYNTSFSGTLKNAVDWASRPEPGEPTLVAFTGKVAGLVSASPGALGGLRGLASLRSVLSGIGVLVLPEQVAVPRANEALDEEGRPKDERLAGSVRRLAARLWTVTSKLAVTTPTAGR